MQDLDLGVNIALLVWGLERWWVEEGDGIAVFSDPGSK